MSVTLLVLFLAFLLVAEIAGGVLLITQDHAQGTYQQHLARWNQTQQRNALDPSPLEGEADALAAVDGSIAAGNCKRRLQVGGEG